ncbi:hypothetical protein ACJX0J_014824 [Zea mays]
MFALTNLCLVVLALLMLSAVHNTKNILDYVHADLLGVCCPTQVWFGSPYDYSQNVEMITLILVALDVKTAFLHGDLEEDIYMDQPEGLKKGLIHLCFLMVFRGLNMIVVFI